MLDKMLLRATKPAVEFVAGQLRRRGVSADQVTLTGFAGGVVAAGLIALGHPGLALWPLLFNRLCDGLDGAVARGSGASDRGAFLDISLDFIFYGLIPLAFALMDPAANGVYAALLLAAFIGTGSSFLAYAILAEKRGQ
ncbi:MAG: CDP-alcohol phosphatidyltransferase family protein [Hyphomicrobiales bacterium]